MQKNNRDAKFCVSICYYYNVPCFNFSTYSSTFCIISGIYLNPPLLSVTVLYIIKSVNQIPEALKMKIPPVYTSDFRRKAVHKLPEYNIPVLRIRFESTFRPQAEIHG